MPRGCDTRSYARPVDGDLNPAQAATLAMLRGEGDRPSYDPVLRDHLRKRLEEGVADLADLVPGKPEWIGKTPLGRVFACEGYEVAEHAEDFGWNLSSSRGAVAHKAVELSVHTREAPLPVLLVDRAVGRFVDDPDSSLGTFLGGLDDLDLAELRSEVVSTVSDFLDQWPPLKPAWRPTTEAKVKAELCGGKVIVQGKVDLALGAPAGTTAGRVLVELKTGGFRQQHLDDLRLYALLETLRVGVPPLRLAVHLLDSGRLVVAEVDEDALEAALLRTIAGVRALLELRLGLRSPLLNPNHACSWCPARETCEGAVRWAETDPDDEP